MVVLIVSLFFLLWFIFGVRPCAVDGTSASLSSLQGVSSQMLRHQGPSLTPSLANYVRTDLIAHVMNWPADILEKQVRAHSQFEYEHIHNLSEMGRESFSKHLSSV